MFTRSVRGMVPHKTAKGANAMKRLKCFEGVPAPFDKKKRMVVPEALKALRLRDIRATTSLALLATQVGWKHEELVVELESKRKEKSKAFYIAKKAETNLRNKAKAEVSIPEKTKAILQAYGY